ncbi:NAD(P)H-binding protein [Variovorax sp. LT2P21]|uniref:NAD(P)H-binding protein n=1 Tax=Variovorax sp. LT2P21 TaxID=3443731 RepID=UPI003F445928
MTGAPQRQTVGVTGAAGQLGQRVLAHLNRIRPDGMQIRALTRSPAPPSALAAWADEFRSADFGGPTEDLARAFEGLDTLLLVSIEGEDDWREAVQARAVQAAAQAGVRRIVYTSFYDVAPASPSRVAKVHRSTEEAIARTGCQWTFLRNGPYLDNAVLRMAHAAKQGPVFRMAAGDARLPFIARDDLAFAAAQALVGEGHDTGAYRLGGPRLLSFHDLARIVGAKLGSPLRYEAIDDSAYQAELQAISLAPDMILRRLAYVRAMREGFMSALSPDFERLTGRQPQDARDAVAAMDLEADRPLH